MILAIILLAGCSLALPTPEAEETDGPVSRKILGSSVVTSVSVIMDVGNGSQTYFSDAVGKPMTKPSAATQLASPINLLNPDRYEFYTFDDSGDLVKRLMTLDEIQGIIASGDGESSNYNSQSLTGDAPEKRVDDVVNNVQNVLKEEMEAHKTSEVKPTFDTPDITSTWNMILPGIFGNSGENGMPNKQQNGITAETIMIEPTTLLPLMNDSNVRTDTTMHTKETTNMFTIPDVTTEGTSNTSSQTENSSEEMDTPIISVEINSNDSIMHDEAPIDGKTESSYVSPITNNLKDDDTLSFSETRPVIVISTPSPFTNKVETSLPSTISSTSAPITLSSTPPTTVGPTLLPSTLPPQNEITTPHGQLSTFFLVEDNKHRPETTTTLYSTPGPFTLPKVTTMKDNAELKTESTNFRPSLFTEIKFPSTESYFKRTIIPLTKIYPPTAENIDNEYVKGNLNIDSLGNVIKVSPTRRTTLTTKPYPSTKLSSTDATIFSSTEEVVTQSPSLQTSTVEVLNDNENIRFSTTSSNQFDENTSTNKPAQETELPLTEKPEDVAFTKLSEPTTENIDSENQAVTELLNQLLLTTRVYEINPEPLVNATTLENTQPKTQPTTETADRVSTTEQIITTNINFIPISTLKPEKNSSTTSEANLVSSIEQIISQAVDNPEQSIENIKEGEKITEVIQNTNSKPMSQVQIETATAASALIGTPNTESIRNVTLEDEQVNQAVDSLISQIIYHQPIQTSEVFSTTNNIEKNTEQTTILNTNEPNIGNNDDINRYEEIDLIDVDTSTISNFESKTVKPMLLLNNKESSYTTEVPEKTTSSENQIIELSTLDAGGSSTELDQEETKHQSTLFSEIYGTTEKLVQDYILSTQYKESSPKNPTTVLNIATEKETFATSTENLSQTSELNQELDNQTSSNNTTEDYPTSTEIFDTTSKSNEILKSSASEVNQENYNENSSEPFLIVTSSSEYPDYASTEIVDVFAKNTAYDSTTSGEMNDGTETITDSITRPQFSTQNFPESVSTTQNYETTRNNLVTDPQAQTTQENLQIKYETTEINEQFKQTTEEDFSQTQPSTEKINSSTTQQFNINTVTEQEIFDSTPQPLSTIYQQIISITPQSVTASTTQQPLISSTQEPLTASTIQQRFASTTQQPTTILVTQPTTEQQTTVSENISSVMNTPIIASPVTPAFINLPTVTISPKIEKPAELKLIQNITSSSTTAKPDMTWTLVSTVVPHKTVLTEETKTQAPHRQEPTSVDLVPKPLQGFGLEDSTSSLDTDVFQFTELCNELAFSFWSSVTSGISFARSVIVSPFAATSMLAMVFLGARGSTSGEMNEILKLDDMVTFNPHSIFKNVIESIEVSKKSGVAVSVFVKELYSDKNKGKLLNFYKERVKQFYDGHVEEANFKEINDVIRRRTNLLVKRQTWGKIPEYLKDNNLFARPPLAAVSANIFQTDCSEASTEGRDGELHFVVLPSIRQRKLVPIPAVVWRSGFLAGYDPGLDATAVAVGTKDQTISTIFVIPGQQGISAPGDGLMRLEARLVESAFRQGGWSRLLRSLIPRPGLEVQIPRFSHKSVINATMALQRMGLKDLFNSNTADLKGLNGVAHELYLSDIVQVNTFATCGEGRIEETHHSEVYPATTNRSFRRIRKIQHYHHSEKPFENSDILEEPRDYQRAFHDPLYDPSYLSLPLQLRPRQARLPEAPRLRFDRPFLYFVRHNPTGLIIHMGRFNPRLLP